MTAVFKLKPPMLSEHVEQSMLITWWSRYARTKGLDPRLLFAIPNGAVLAGDVRSRCMQMAKLKAEGFRPGAPDLLLAVPSGGFHGLFMEMKRIGAKASAAQLEYATLLRQQHYNVVIAQGFEEARRAITVYLEYPATEPRKALFGSGAH